MLKVIKRGNQEYASAVREIMQDKKTIRVKVHLSYYDPRIQKYQLMKGESVTFDVNSVTFVLGLRNMLDKFLCGE